MAPRPHTSWLLAHLVASNTLSAVDPSRLIRALGFEAPVAEGGGAQAPLSKEEALLELTGGIAISELEADDYVRYIRNNTLLLRELQVSPGQQVLIVNGRVRTIPFVLRVVLRSADHRVS